MDERNWLADIHRFIYGYEWGYGVAVHQISEEDGLERPVLFLLKALTSAEKNYGATELECAALVWALAKLPQYTDSGFTVITDHTALVNALQGKSAGRSARLNRWALFLADLLPRMKIMHRRGRQNNNADALSRFPTSIVDSEELTEGQSEELREVLNTAGNAVVNCSSASKPHISVHDDFLQQVRELTPTDRSLRGVWRKISDQMEDNKGDSYHSFQLSDGLLYHERGNLRRLCIPKKLQKDVFELTHDDIGHPGGQRT